MCQIRAAVLAAGLVAACAPAAGAGCGQQITLLGVTAGEPPVAWITEDIGGDCGFSFLVQLAVEPDTVRATVTPMDIFAEWEWLIRGQMMLRAYEPPADTTALDVTSTPNGADGPVLHTRRPPDAAPVTRVPVVTAPRLSKVWHSAFLRHLDEGGSDAVTWNEEWGPAGIEPPLVDGAPGRVVYAFPHGLYVNYDVASVHELPYGYLLVITSQPALGLLLNTMHGFLVVRPAS